MPVGRIERTGLPAMAGSHVAGIFGKGANGFEKEVRAYVAQLLKDCGLNYASQLRRQVLGPTFPKTTLGHLVAIIREATVLTPKVSTRVPAVHPPFLVSLERINDIWVQLKHGDEVEKHAFHPDQVDERCARRAPRPQALITGGISDASLTSRRTARYAGRESRPSWRSELSTRRRSGYPC